MAAHRASRPPVDPLEQAERVISDHLAAGDVHLRRRLLQLLDLAEPVTVMPRPQPHHDDLPAEFDYDAIPDPEARDWAESAAGFITFGLERAALKVQEAGGLLRQARQRLTPAEHLPWVRIACGLQPRDAAQLEQAADHQGPEVLFTLGATPPTPPEPAGPLVDVACHPVTVTD